ncbi:MAG: DEAD/DEAH box helicase family protein, partial [Deltaproteobacteria bacterium]|nr:DEAD/DEAH box helicase family protein [Deltaproteobacteria bacterium]
MTRSSRWADVAIPVPLRQLFTYRVPEAMTLVSGHRVAVRFGARNVAGVVVRVREPNEGEPEPKGLRDVVAVLDGEPIFEEELMRFLHDAAEYYLAPPGEVLKTAAPALRLDDVRALRDAGLLGDGEKLGAATSRKKVEIVRLPTGAEVAPPEGKRLGPAQRALLDVVRTRVEVEMDDLRAHARSPRTVVRALVERGLVELIERDVPADRFFARPVPSDVPPPLSPDQERVTARLADAVAKNDYCAFLLYGVTGSGKTEVYLRAVREARALGRGVLVLVPEIGLTPQLVSRFRARFGDRLAVLHSGLKPAERLAFWRAVRSGELPIVIGAR